jgi:hypothetical protein
LTPPPKQKSNKNKALLTEAMDRIIRPLAVGKARLDSARGESLAPARALEPAFA